MPKTNFKVRGGDFVALVGPSGSGKSTLMNIIGLLDSPTTGTYILEGENIARLKENELARIRNKNIGFVFQSFNLLQRTPVLDNVSLPLIYAGFSKSERDQKAKEALARVGLEDKFQSFPNQLSGGQQQRVAIARAIVTNPKFVLADEPTGNLDSKTGEEIFKIFKGLNEKGKTIILITHSEDIAKRAKRIIRIKDGKIVN
ncbi:ABC transporter ATP-binding protein [Candidatus Woesebacteria bacterium]|nr:ABC transporter ATP-binding protein [Candidatus Woesebacteria bacterium]